MVKAFLFVILSSFFLVSCTVSPLQLVPSTTPITSNTSYTNLGPVEGSSCRFSLLFLPISFGNGGLQEAVTNALEQQGADALINVAVDQTTTFLLLGLNSCTTVHGVAIKILNK
jgi:hypothetical protein